MSSDFEDQTFEKADADATLSHLVSGNDLGLGGDVLIQKIPSEVISTVKSVPGVASRPRYGSYSQARMVQLVLSS